MNDQQQRGIGAGGSARTHYLLPNISLLLLLLLAAALRFYRLDGSSLWSDEGNTWALMSRSFPQIAQSAAADIHPPGYYWLLKFWSIPFGTTAWAMRSFSVLVGVALVLVIYKIAKQVATRHSPLATRHSPLLATLLAALNPFQIYYSQEARMYLLLALESAALFWALFVLVSPAETGFLPRNRLLKKLPALGFCLCAIAGLWTHYTFPIILAAANVTGLWLTRYAPRPASHDSHWQRLQPLLFANLFALLAFLPWLPTAIDRVLQWPKGGISTPLPEAINLTLRTLTFGPLPALPDPQWPWLVGGALLPLLGVLAARRSPLGIALALWLVAPIVLLLGLGLFSPAFLKFLLVASPAWCLAGAAAPSWFRETLAATRYTLLLERSAYSVVGLFAVGLALVTLPGYYGSATARDNYAGIARYVQVMGDAERDLVLLNAPGQQEVWRYYDPGLPILALPQQRPPDSAQTLALLADRVRDRRQIFALFWATDEADPAGIVEQWLDQQAFKGWESWQGNVRFVTYSLPQGLACKPLQPSPHFGAQITLTGICQPDTPPQVAAGAVALVGLRWQTSEPIAQSYKVTVQLLDERNQVIAQQDGEPAGGSQPTTVWAVGATVADNHGLLIPIGTPPGAYRLIVALYAASDGQRLLVESADALDLGVIHVIRPQRILPLDILPIDRWLDQPLGPVRLVGYDVYRKDAAHARETPLAVGDLVHFTFYWQAPAALGPNWLADLGFRLHLGDQLVEAPLAGGYYPTGQWQPGEFVRGEFDLPFDGQSTAAELTIDQQIVRLSLPPLQPTQ